MKKKLSKSYPRLDLDVTAEDILPAIAKDSAHCVIADRLRRAGMQRPEVDLQIITFTDPKRKVRVSFLTPEICQDHLLAFDQELPIEPFDFYLRTPIQIRRAGVGAGRPKTSTAKVTREARLVELTGREAAGTLTSRERVALEKMRATDAAGGLGQPSGPKEIVFHENNARPVFVGGNRTVAKAAVLSNRKGRRRQYGLRQTAGKPELVNADPERAT